VTRILTPKQHEPIRLIKTQGGNRYRVKLDVAPKGAPRQQKTWTFDTLAEARRHVTQTRDRLARGTFTAPSTISMRSLTEDWLKSRRDIRAVSLKGYRSVLAHVLDRLGDRPAQSVTRRDVDALVEWLRTDAGRKGTGLSQRTIVYTLGAVRQVFAYGVSTGLLPNNPAIDVKAPRRKRGDKKPVVPWEATELLRFREKADRDSLAAGFRLTLCGLRRSEVLGLSWDAVDLDAGTVRIEHSRVLIGKGETERDDPKSDASARTVEFETIQPGTVALLRALRKRQAQDRLSWGSAYANPDNLVVVDEIGNGVHPDAYTARFRALSKAAKVREVGIHSVRHGLALTLHRAGVAPADAAALLGHTVTTHLAFYTVNTERGAASAAVALGEALARSH
jgi:integrase